MLVIRKHLIAARGKRTQTEVAKLVGVEQQTYSHWERGRSKPSIAKMLLLEKILEVPKEKLFYDVFNSPAELAPCGAPTSEDEAV